MWHLRRTWDNADPRLYERFEQMVEVADVMVVGRLAETSVSPGRDAYNDYDETVSFSTVFVQLDVDRVLVDNPAYPVDRSVAVELLLPPDLTAADFAGAAPVGQKMLFAGVDATDAELFELADGAEIADGERIYNPLLQSLVVEDETGGFSSVSSRAGVLSLPDSVSVPDRFEALIALVDELIE